MRSALVFRQARLAPAIACTIALVSVSAAGCGDDNDKSTDARDGVADSADVPSPGDGDAATVDDTAPDSGADAADDAVAPDVASDIGADGGDDADVATPSGDFACLGTDMPYPQPVDENVTWQATLVDYLSGDALAGVGVKYCARVDPTCAEPLHLATSDADGKLDAKVPSGFDGFIVASGGGVAPSIRVVDPPIFAAPANTSFRLLSSGALTALGTALGTSVDAADGHLVAVAVDCTIAPAPGVTLTFESTTSESGGTFAYLAAGFPSSGAEATDASGMGVALNVAPGWYTVRANTADGAEYGRARALVAAGVITQVVVAPTQTTPDLRCGDATARVVAAAAATPTLHVRDTLTYAPIAGASVKLCPVGDDGCAAPLQEGTTAADGSFEIDLGVDLTSFGGIVQVTGDRLFATRHLFNPPLAITDMPERFMIDVPSAETVATFALVSGVTLSPDTAQLAVRALDCDAARAHGMKVATDALASTATVVYTVDGVPTPEATATDDAGFAAVLDVAVGAPVVVTTSAGASPVGSVTVVPQAGWLYAVDVVPSPRVSVASGPFGHIGVYEDYAIGDFKGASTIVHFSDAPECVAYVRASDAPDANAGVMSLEGAFLAGEPALSFERDQCANTYFYVGPTYPFDDSLTVDVVLDADAPFVDFAARDIVPSPAKSVTVTAPVPADDGSLAMIDGADFDIAWQSVEGGVGQQMVVGGVFSASSEQPTVELYCAFPLADGAARIPGRVLSEVALRLGSGGSGWVHLFAGGQREVSAGASSYLVEVARALDSTNLAYDAFTILDSPRLAPSPSEPPEPPPVPEPSGPTPPGGIHCARAIGGLDVDFANAVAVAPDGGIYVAGSFALSGNFGADIGDTLIGDGTLADIFLARYDGNCQLEWVRRAGGDGFDTALALVLAADGAVYISGTFSNDATFGAGEAHETTLTSQGSADFYVARYAADGALAWVSGGGGPGFERAFGLSATSDGVLVTGRFEQTATFDGSELAAPGVYGHAPFVARYDDEGGLTWIRQGGDGTADADFFDVEAVGGDAVVVGNWQGPGLVLGAGEAGEVTLDVCDVDAFLARFGGDGDLVWAKRFGGGGFDYPAGLDATADGALRVTGSFGRDIRFGEGAGAIALHGDGTDLFVAAYDADGVAESAVVAGGPFSDAGRDVRALVNGGFVVVGSMSRYDGMPAFGTFGESDANRSVLVGSGNDDVVVAVYDAQAKLSWARVAGGLGSDNPGRVAVAPNGDIVLVGAFKDAAASFDDAVLTPLGGFADGYLVVIRP